MESNAVSSSGTSAGSAKCSRPKALGAGIGTGCGITRTGLSVAPRTAAAVAAQLAKIALPSECWDVIATSGEAGIAAYVGAFFVPTLIGNVIGGVTLVLWLGAQDVIAGQMTVGELVGFNTYLMMLAWPTYFDGAELEPGVEGGVEQGRGELAHAAADVLGEHAVVDDAVGDEAAHVDDGRKVLVRLFFERLDVRLVLHPRQRDALAAHRRRVAVARDDSILEALDGADDRVLNVCRQRRGDAVEVQPRVFEPFRQLEGATTRTSGCVV